MAKIFYHGTTKERLRSIDATGLRKGTFVSPDSETANWFAAKRAQWNGQDAIVLSVSGPVSSLRQDRSGRWECCLLANTKPTQTAPSGGTGVGEQEETDVR